MIIQKIQAFQQSCSLIWPLPAGFQRCTACSREDSWMPPQVGNSWIPNMAEMVYSYMAIWHMPKTLGFVAFLVPVPPKLWYLQHFHPFDWLARRQKLVVYAAFLALGPHTWRIWCLSTLWSWKIARLINVHHSINSISIFTHLSLSFLTLSCLYRFLNLA